MFNINIPNLDEGECNGLKFAELDFSIQRNSYIKESTPSGKVDYWLKGHSIPLTFAAFEGYITVTPLEIEMTRQGSKENIEIWFNEELVSLQ